MDRDAMVRSQRRRLVGELLDDERGREVALAERLEEVVAEADGARIDDQLFRRMDPADVTLVREVLQPASAFEEDDEAESDWADDEIARLEDEIAASRRRQLAYERYLEALEG